MWTTNNDSALGYSYNKLKPILCRDDNTNYLIL